MSYPTLLGLLPPGANIRRYARLGWNGVADLALATALLALSVRLCPARLRRVN